MANIFTHCYLPFLGIVTDELSGERVMDKIYKKYTHDREIEESEEEIEEALTAGELIKILKQVDPNTKVGWTQLDNNLNHKSNGRFVGFFKRIKRKDISIDDFWKDDESSSIRGLSLFERY